MVSVSTRCVDRTSRAYNLRNLSDKIVLLPIHIGKVFVLSKNVFVKVNIQAVSLQVEVLPFLVVEVEGEGRRCRIRTSPIYGNGAIHLSPKPAPYSRDTILICNRLQHISVLSISGKVVFEIVGSANRCFSDLEITHCPTSAKPNDNVIANDSYSLSRSRKQVSQFFRFTQITH